MQLFDLMPDTYYDNYAMTTRYSPSMREHMESQAERFAWHHGLRTCVEIGSGDGTFLEHLEAKGVRVKGVEPSVKFRLRCNRAVYPDYVSQGHPAPGGPYDGFVARQVLEHVPDPVSFLRGCKESAAVGLIEVPSLLHTRRHGRWYDFFPDHVNYFDEDTLTLAAHLAGLKVSRLHHTFHNEYLEMDVYHEDDGLVAYDVRVPDIQEPYAMWGAGAKGVSVLHLLTKKPEYIVDIDPNKQGRTIHGVGIYSPERLATHPVEAVLISAMTYEHEIRQQLKGRKVYTLA